MGVGHGEESRGAACSRRAAPDELGFRVGGFWQGSAGEVSVASGSTGGPSSP